MADDIVDNGLLESEVDTLAQIYQIVHYLMEDMKGDERPGMIGAARV